MRIETITFRSAPGIRVICGAPGSKLDTPAFQREQIIAPHHPLIVPDHVLYLDKRAAAAEEND